jgi:hypothetical protein
MLSDVVKKISKGKVYACWSGVVYDLKNRYIRADKVFLNTVQFVDGYDSPVYTRIPGTYEISPAGEKRILFATEDLMRIQEGPRKGRLVPLSDLKKGEKHTVAGVRKVVQEGNRSGQLSPRRPGDCKIVKLLSTMKRVRKLSTLRSNIPVLYLTCPAHKSKLQCRSDSRSMAYMKNMPGYNEALPMDTNLHRLGQLLAQPAGNHREAYPFDIVYGKGVVTADAVNENCIFGTWCSVDSLELSLPHIRIGKYNDV